MNFNLMLAILFYGLIVLFYLRNKKKFRVQGKVFFLYPTHLGLKLMDKIAHRFSKILKPLAYLSITLGFIGMGIIFYQLLKGALNLFLKPEAPPSVAPVLPGVEVPGLPPLSFFHWIIAIFIVAVVHEFSHGIFARLYKIKVKSSGFAFLGPILAAFVEPDEKKLTQAKKRKQLAVFSAGPFSNVVFGFIFLLIFQFISLPIQAGMIESNGIIISNVVEGSPAHKAGLSAPLNITSFNGQEIKRAKDISKFLQDINPGDEVIFTTESGVIYNITTGQNPKDHDIPYIGINFFDNNKIKERFQKGIGYIQYKVIEWFNLLFIWLFAINFGIALFNLLPLAFVDGGRMFLVGLGFFFKNKKTARKLWGIVSLISMLLVVINLLPWFSKLFSALWNYLLLLISLIL